VEDNKMSTIAPSNEQLLQEIREANLAYWSWRST
jgi:hypothetical protein